VGLTFFLFFFTEFLPSFCAAVLSHSSLFALPQCKKKEKKRQKKRISFVADVHSLPFLLCWKKKFEKKLGKN